MLNVEKREFFFCHFFYEGEEEEENVLIESVFFWHVFSTTHTHAHAKKKIHARF